MFAPVSAAQVFKRGHRRKGFEHDLSGCAAEADDALSVYITAKVNVMDKSLDDYLALRERFCPEAPGTPEWPGQQ